MEMKRLISEMSLPEEHEKCNKQIVFLSQKTLLRRTIPLSLTVSMICRMLAN